MNHKKLYALLSSGLMALASCTKTGNTGPAGAAGAAGPSFTGAISGHAYLYDQYGSRVLTNLNTVQLSLSSGAVATADANGYYIFPGISTGEYTLTVSGTGYAATKNKFGYLSDTLTHDVKMSQIPNFSATGIASYPTMGTVVGDSVVVSFNADPRNRYYILFINSSSGVSNGISNYLITYVRGINANQTKSSFVIPAQDLTDAGIASGSAVYIAAYGYVIGDASVYEDLATGRSVYNAVGANPVTTTAVAP